MFFFSVDLPQSVIIYLLDKMAEVEHRLAANTDEKIQLSSLVAAFQVARNAAVKLKAESEEIKDEP